MADGVETVVNAGKSAGKNVPPVVWIIAVVGGLGVSFYLSKSKKKSSGSSTEDMSPQTLVYTGIAGGAPGSSTIPDTGSGAPKTNEEWAQRAKDALLAMRYSGIDVDRAINAYLGGATLTAAQQSLVSLAISKIGTPPLPLPPSAGPPDPGPGGGGDTPVADRVTYGQKPQGQVYTVKQGDTLASIAALAYGIGPGATAQTAEAITDIYNANWMKIKDPKVLAPGTELYVPVKLSLQFQSQGDRVGKIPLGKGAQPGDEKKEWIYDSGLIDPKSAYYGSGERLGY